MKERRHSIDILFALILFALFAVSSMTLILLGAKVYGSAAEKMNKTDGPLLLSYLTEKLRSCPDEASVQIGEDGTLLLKKETGNGIYTLWLYQEDGCLQEVLLPEGRTPQSGTGNRIGEVETFRVGKAQDHLLILQLTDGFGREYSRYYSFLN